MHVTSGACRILQLYMLVSSLTSPTHLTALGFLIYMKPSGTTQRSPQALPQDQNSKIRTPQQEQGRYRHDGDTIRNGGTQNLSLPSHLSSSPHPPPPPPIALVVASRGCPRSHHQRQLQKQPPKSRPKACLRCREAKTKCKYNNA